MKKSASILIAIITIAIHSFGQSVEPQFWFYSKTAPVFGNNANDVEENNTLSLQIKLNNLFGNYFSNEQILEMYYRIYEIQNTSEILYSTDSYYSDGVPFVSESSPEKGYIHVDFGSPLIENESDDNNPEYSHRLRFASPIQKVDPELFSYWVQQIKLPPTTDLSYTSSPNIFTTLLVLIEGYDVYNYSALISKDSTLVVAATSAKTNYKIPELVKRIGAGALRGTLLRRLIIPSNVSSIGDNAFDLSDIQDYYIMSTKVPSIGQNVFGEKMDKKTTIYVPKESLRTYKKAWKPLKRHIKAIPKSFDPNMADEIFNPNRYYKIQSGLALKDNNCVYNRNNRFVDKDFSMTLNKYELLLWKHLKQYGTLTNIDWMANLLFMEFEEFNKWEDAKECCLTTMKKWFDTGLVIKISNPNK